jgi:Putative Ig domain
MRAVLRVGSWAFFVCAISISSGSVAAGSSVSFVGSTTYTSGPTLVTTFGIPVPVGVAPGDLLLASMYHGANPNPTITAPSGWIQLYQDWTAAGGKHTVFYRIAGATEPSKYSWRLSASKQVAAGMLAYRGVTTSGPFHALGTAHVLGSSVGSVSLTTTLAGTHLVVFVAAKTSAAGLSPEPTLTERYDVYASSRALAVADEVITSVGQVTRSVRIDDPAGAAEIFAFALALLPDDTPNQPPAVDAVLEQTSVEGEIVARPIVATDVDGDALTFSAVGLPPGLVIDKSTGLISGTVATGAAGGSPYTVIVSVRDALHSPVEVTFAWRVGMPSIAFVGATSFSSVDLMRSFTLNVPRGVQGGDFLIMSMIHGGDPDPTITAPAGWTQLYQDRTVNGGKHTIYYKFASASEPSSYMWQLSASKHPGAGMAAYRGVSLVAPIHALAQAHAFASASLSLELTTQIANTRLLVFAAAKTGAPGMTPDSRLSERYDAYGPPRTVQMADQVLLSPGTVSRTAFVDAPGGAEEIFGVALALSPDQAAHPPIISPIPDQFAIEGEVVDLSIVVTNGEGNPLTYGATGLPPGLTMGVDGRITGTIQAGAAAGSPYTVKVTVSDGIYSPAVASFRWTVSSTGSNPITYVGSTTFSSGANTIRSFAVKVPAGTAPGDLLLMSMYHGANPNPVITAPAGWLQLSQDATSAGGKHTVFYKVAGGSEPASYSWQLSGSKQVAAGMAAYRGVDTTTPFHAQTRAHVLNATSVSLQLTTAIENTRLVVLTAAKSATAGLTPGTGLTERYDVYAMARAVDLADAALALPGTVTRSVAVDAAAGAEEIFAVAVALVPRMR